MELASGDIIMVEHRLPAAKGEKGELTTVSVRDAPFFLCWFLLTGDALFVTRRSLAVGRWPMDGIPPKKAFTLFALVGSGSLDRFFVPAGNE